jgi:hypothetical protein
MPAAARAPLTMPLRFDEFGSLTHTLFFAMTFGSKD